MSLHPAGTTTPAAATAPPTARLLRLTGALALLFGLLLFVPIAVLGAAIDWPASLSEPAAEIIPRLDEQATAVTLGYLVYLLYSVLFFPVIAMLSRVLGDTPVTRAAATFAAISTVARSIGIIRWLSVLPLLAATQVTTPDAAIPVVFDAVNAWGGAIGELLGVSAFAALSLALVSTAIIRSTVLPTWLGASGFVVVAGLLLPWIEVFGVDLGAIISVSSALVQFWFLALGIVLFVVAARRPAGARRDAEASDSIGVTR